MDGIYLLTSAVLVKTLPLAEAVGYNHIAVLANTTINGRKSAIASRRYHLIRARLLRGVKERLPKYGMPTRTFDECSMKVIFTRGCIRDECSGF